MLRQWDEFTTVLKGSFRSSLQATAAWHFHPHDRHTSDIIIPYDLCEFLGIIDTVKLWTSDQGDLPLHKGELVNLIKWQNDELSRLGVEIRLSTEATVDMIKEMNPDEVILATGGKPFIPPIPGADLPHVVQANEILLQNASFGKNVAVLGGGSVGVETAEYMDYCGSKTTIIEMMDDILIGLERETRLMSLNSIREYQIQVYTQSRVTNISEDSITFNRKGKDVTLDEIDTVVVAAGSRPVNQLAEPLEALGIKVTSVGDAKKVRNGLAAVYEGYMAGYQC